MEEPATPHQSFNEGQGFVTGRHAFVPHLPHLPQKISQMVALKTEFPEEFTISTDKMLLDMPWVIDRLLKSYWGGRYTPEKIAEAVANSFCFGLYRPGGDEHGLAQIGFVRVVTDGVTFSSITDVYIEEEYRRKGLGARLMKEVVKHPVVARTICILASGKAKDFYTKFGFVPHSHEDVLSRNPS